MNRPLALNLLKILTEDKIALEKSLPLSSQMPSQPAPCPRGPYGRHLFTIKEPNPSKQISWPAHWIACANCSLFEGPYDDFESALERVDELEGA